MTARRWSRGAGLVASLVFGSLAPLSAAAQEWHELYAGGVAALRSGQPAKAADLLRRAIQKRPQAGRDVPTYGTNFEPRYFPYLRLAEAYLLLGSHDEARKALDTSARQGVEPAEERAALVARVSAAIEAKRPPPEPTPAPTPAAVPSPTVVLPPPTPDPPTPPPAAVAPATTPVPPVTAPTATGHSQARPREIASPRAAARERGKAVARHHLGPTRRAGLPRRRAGRAHGSGDRSPAAHGGGRGPASRPALLGRVL